MVLDYPDWSRVASGATRLLGTLSLSNPGQTTATYTIQPSERSIILIPVGGANQSLSASVTGHVSGMVTQGATWGMYSGSPFAVPAAVAVAAQVDTQWDVAYNLAGRAALTTLYVFASTDPAPQPNAATPLPITLSNGVDYLIGQQAKAMSMPVVLASDQVPLPVTAYPPSPGPFLLRSLTNFGPGTDYPSVQSNVNGARGIEVSMHVTAVNAGAVVQANLVAISLDLAGEWTSAVNLLQSKTLAAPGWVDMLLYPGIAELANVYRSLMLPYYWRVDVAVTIGNASLVVNAAYLP